MPQEPMQPGMPEQLDDGSMPIEAMTDEELLGIVDNEVTWAAQRRDERSDSSEEALNYFYCLAPALTSDNDEECGMSDWVSSDVQDAVYAVCAEIMPAFGGASPVEFQPVSAEDMAQADIETAAVNHVAQNCGIYQSINSAVQDAMLRRAGIIKVYWDRRVSVRYETVEGAPLNQLPGLLQDKQDQRTEVISGEVDDHWGVASGTLRRYQMISKPRIEAVPLDEFLISADLASPNIEEARFIAHQRAVSRSDLIELGLDPDEVGELEVHETLFGELGARARDGQDRELRSAHPSTECVLCVEAYYNVDWDGDGIAERRRIITAGGSQGTDKLLLNEPWADQPFCCGVGYTGIYVWDGVSLFDRLKSVQDAKTGLIRDVLNTVARNMRQRLGVVEGDANPEDVMLSQRGGMVRMATPNGIVPVPDVQLPPTVFQVLQFLDQARKDKGGGAVDATASAQVLGQGGDWSLERLMAATEQLNAMVAKNLVETLVKPVYRKLHNLLREYQPGSISIPGAKGWRSTVPAQWSPREQMVITMGMSVGERTQRLGALQGVLAAHAQDAQTGKAGILSTERNTYQARLDMARLAGLPQPEQYFQDPDSQEAQLARQNMAQQAQAAQQQEQQIQILTAELQYRLMTDVERIKSDAKIAAQKMAEDTKAMSAKLDAIMKLMGHEVKLVEIEQKGDVQEAQQEIDRLQLKAQGERQMAEMGLARQKIEQQAQKIRSTVGTDPKPGVVQEAEKRTAAAVSGGPPPGPGAPGVGGLPQGGMPPGGGPPEATGPL